MRASKSTPSILLKNRQIEDLFRDSAVVKAKFFERYRYGALTAVDENGWSRQINFENDVIVPQRLIHTICKISRFPEGFKNQQNFVEDFYYVPRWYWFDDQFKLVAFEEDASGRGRKFDITDRSAVFSGKHFYGELRIVSYARTAKGYDSIADYVVGNQYTDRQFSEGCKIGSFLKDVVIDQETKDELQRFTASLAS